MKFDGDYFWSVLMATGIMLALPDWEPRYEAMGYVLVGAILLRANTELIVKAIRERQ